MTDQGERNGFARDTSPALEYLRILRRRKWLIGTIATVIISVAIGAAILLPPTYQSVATILIEEPGVSSDLAKSTEIGFADQRLQLIQQRVLTTAKLMQVIDKLGLYKEARKTTPMNILADNMRSQIALRIIGADSTDSKSDRSVKKTTAFTLGFSGRDPVNTQLVARELVEIYMAENERSQRDKAWGTAGFLSAETTRLAEHINELEAKLAAFKTANAGLLPEEMAFNIQLLDRTQNQMLEVMRLSQSIRERQSFFQAQLLSIDPQAPINAANPDALTPRARLRLLTSQYTALTAKFGDQHPDVVNIRRQIEALGGSPSGGAPTVDVADLEADLVVAQQKYGPTHPEIIRLKRVLKAARKAAVRVAAPKEEAPDNPVYIQTRSQLAALDAEMNMSHAQVAALQQKISEVEARVLKGPEVERGYVALKREYDTTVAKYQEMQGRESQADLAKSLEAEQMGERLSLIEPPPLPNSPISPNRTAIALFGFVMGMVIAIGSGLLAESMDGHVYGQKKLAEMMGSSPLVVIPRIVASRDRRRQSNWIALVAASFVLICSVVVMLGGMDDASLDTAWNLFLSRIGAS